MEEEEKAKHTRQEAEPEMGSVSKSSPAMQYSKWSGCFGGCSSVMRFGGCYGKHPQYPHSWMGLCVLEVPLSPLRIVISFFAQGVLRCSSGDHEDLGDLSDHNHWLYNTL